MTLDVEDELRSALRAYRDTLPPPADLAGPASRGGARRQWRRRAALVAVPVVAAAAVATGVALPRLTYTPPDPAVAAASLSPLDRDLLTGGTGGDLAGSDSFVAAARRTWERGHGRSANADRGIFDHMVGAPAVVWAGRTDAGPAAVVVQLADLRAHDDVQLTREGVALVWGFVGQDADLNLTVVADAYPVPGAPDVEAAWLGTDRRVLLVADRGNAGEQVSWGLDYDGATGTVRRQWQPVRFDDGAAVLTAPAGVRPDAVRLRYTGGDAEIGNPGPQPADVDRRLPWGFGDQGLLVFPVGPDPAAGWGGTLPDGYAAQHALMDEGLAGRLPTGWPDFRSQGTSSWYAVGRTPDGRRLVAGEVVFDADPSRVYAALGGPGGRRSAVSAEVHADRAVPVDLTLPDGQGRLVAAKGKTFTWSGGGTARDAALVPAGATDLRVDGTPV